MKNNEEHLTFHLWLFNKIAVFYQWFLKSQIKHYLNIIEANISNLSLQKNAKILDLGCGTGAFGLAFQKLGYQVIGVDGAPRMVKIAQKNNLNALNENFLNGLSFEDKTFDLVIASYVLHGISAHSREKIYEEAKRLSKNQILFHDYNSNKKFFTSIIEWIERGDYFNFIKVFKVEIKKAFVDVKIFDLGGHSSLYICS